MLARLGHWLDSNFMFLLSVFLLAFVPLYPKLPLFDILPGYIVRVRIEDLLIALAGLTWLVQLIRHKITWQSPLFKMIGIYTTVGFLSLLSAIIFTQTIPPELLHIGKSTLHWLRYIEYFFLFLMMFASLKTAKQVKLVVLTLVLSVLAISVYGVGQKYWYWPVYSTMNREFSKGMRLYLTEHARVQSTFGGHYDLGAYLVIALPLILALAYKANSRWERRLLFFTHAFGLWLLIVSASRAPFIAYLAAAGLVIVFTTWDQTGWKKRLWTFVKRSIGFGVLLTFLLVTFGEDINERLMQTLESRPEYPQFIATYDYWNARRKDLRDNIYAYLGLRDFGPPANSIAFDNLDPVLTPTDELPISVRPSDVYEDIPDLVEVASGSGTVFVEQQRTWSANALKYGLSMGIRLDTLWPNAIKGFMRNPLLGTGYATLNKEGAYQFTEADSTDNNYLRALGETGLLGFLAYFGTIVLVLKSTAKHLFDQNQLKSALAIGIFAGSIGLLLNALYIDVFAASKVALTYWALVGLVLATLALKIPTSKTEAQTLLK